MRNADLRHQQNRVVYEFYVGTEKWHNIGVSREAASREHEASNDILRGMQADDPDIIICIQVQKSMCLSHSTQANSEQALVV